MLPLPKPSSLPMRIFNASLEDARPKAAVRTVERETRILMIVLKNFESNRNQVIGMKYFHSFLSVDTLFTSFLYSLTVYTLLDPCIPQVSIMTIACDNRCRNNQITGPDIAGRLSPALSTQRDSVLITRLGEEA
jgi:hypothetical protein